MFSTVSLFLRKTQNCWCNCNCSTLVSLSVRLLPCSFFYCWCPELCPRSFIFSQDSNWYLPWTFALFVLKLHSRCCLHLKQVCCSLEKNTDSSRRKFASCFWLVKWILRSYWKWLLFTFRTVKEIQTFRANPLYIHCAYDNVTHSAYSRFFPKVIFGFLELRN